MTSHIHDGAQWFIRAVRNTLEKNNAGDEGVEQALGRLGEQDTSRDVMIVPRATRLPACRFLPDAVASSLLAAPDVAASIAALEEDLMWVQNPNYSNEKMGQPNYMDNYAYCEVIGPRGIYPGNDFLMGLFLMGSGLRYLDHAHPAPELYWLLSGDSQWRMRDEPFEPREPGETIWHEPYVPHATNVGHQPLLCVYMWTRDVQHAAMLV
ncbi:MAG: dimethylsulfonioproprionate lyase family protein [Anderseniella sp.]